MKKFKSMMYWVGVLVSYLVAFTLLGMILVFILRLPLDSMFSGFAAVAFIICALLFTADDETRDMIKKIIKKGDNVE